MKRIVFSVMVITALLLSMLSSVVNASGLDITPIFYKGSINDNGNITALRRLETIESGNIIAGIKINSLPADGITPRVFVALYEVESEQLRLNSVYTIAPSQITAGTKSVECAVGLTVPNDDKEYKIKVMTWENDENRVNSLYKRFVLGTSPSESVSVGEESGNISQLIEYAQASEYSLLRADWESENNVLQFVNE